MRGEEHRQGILICRERENDRCVIDCKDVQDGEEEQGQIQLTATADTAK